MTIINATSEHLDMLIPLFDGYRIFYKQASEPDKIREFLARRFEMNDTIFYLALAEEGEALGFTQLFPSFSSVSMQRLYILNDLYVAAKHRGKGVGEALLNRAKERAIRDGAKGLTLETGIDNPAQHLYERLDWKKDVDVFHYTWTA